MASGLENFFLGLELKDSRGDVVIDVDVFDVVSVDRFLSAQEYTTVISTVRFVNCVHVAHFVFVNLNQSN